MAVDVKSSVCTMGEETDEPTAQRANPPVAVIARSEATAKALAVMLEQIGCSIALSAVTAPLLPPVRLLVFEVAGDEIATRLPALRSALSVRRVPVLVVVGNAVEGRQALDQGASDFLVRPVSSDVLRAVATRLLNRGRVPVKPATADSILVVSDDLYQLLAIGSSLQKKAGYRIFLSRTLEEARDRAREHPPAVLLADLRPSRAEVRAFYAELQARAQKPKIVAMLDPGETLPRDAGLAGAIIKPLSLIGLSDDLQRMTGIAAPGADDVESARLLQAEIVRIMNSHGPSAPA
jgi:DNA-binding response OmpR family regulator